MTRVHLRDWRAKAAIQQLFTHVPGGGRANELFQRHVTHGLPHSDAELDAMVELGRHHLDRLTTHAPEPVGAATFFEFGAGADLITALVLHALGAGPQIAVDLHRLARLDLVEDAVARIDRLLGPPRTAAGDAPKVTAPATVEGLLATRAIDYRAPCDARATRLPSASIDCVTSTNTMEHIPPADLARILVECRRILRPDGVMSCQVDYQDHYAYFDPRITVYNFLRYTDRQWRWCNPALHHQNRRRHATYVALFRDAGFTILDEGRVPVTDADLALLAGVDLAPEFRDLPPEEVAIRGARFVVRKAPA